MAGTIEERVENLVKPLIESLNIELWGIRYRGGRAKPLLQIFIETKEGVNADMCADVTNLISPALDAEDIIAPAYVLEVSSPGLDRILFNEKQASLYIDKEVSAELRLPFEGRKKFSGKLLKVEGDEIVLDDKLSGETELSFSNIQTLRVIPSFEKNAKPGKGSN